MDLIISEQEYNDAVGQIGDAAEELRLIAGAYTKILQGLKASGYKSQASAAAIDNRCKNVQAAVEAFEQALDGLPKKTERHLGTIASIDRLVN